MKVKGDYAPDAPVSVEEIPDRAGVVLARFYENVHEYHEERDGVESSGYEWDEYHMELLGYPGLLNDLLAEADAFCSQAKELEHEKNTIPILKVGQAQDRADIEYMAMMTGVDL